MKKIIFSFAVLGLLLNSCSSPLEGLDSTTATHVSLYGSSVTKSSLSGSGLVSAGMTLAEINAEIAQASAGDTVWVEAGTYLIDGALLMKPGITLIKSGNTNPIFDARASDSQLLRQTFSAANVAGCTFSGITFWNLTFYINNASDVTFKWCIFDYGIKKAGSNKSNDLHDAYIRLIGTDKATVSNCVFSRRQGNSGRGVWNGSGSTNSKIINNTFGNAGTTGYFITAINDNSQSNSLISGNTILRNVSFNNEDANTDHGIYAHSFNGLTIQNNVIKGWPANGSGGAIKARNGENLAILNNEFHTSGILLYIYIEPSSYQYLKNVQVKNNKIYLDSLTGGMYGGIGYWRQSGVTGQEESILISGNEMPNGSISISGSNGFSSAQFNLSGGGVFNNDLHLPFLSLAAGVSQSGNY